MSHDIISPCHMLYHVHIYDDIIYDIIYYIMFDIICNITYDIIRNISYYIIYDIIQMV